MTFNNSQRAVPAPELIETMTGSPVTIGTLIAPPVQIIFDNLGDATVVISINGVEWKTFGPQAALVLDMRANHGIASNYSFDNGTVISGDGASGDFSVAYTYARE